jgi:hypothetical protein
MARNPAADTCPACAKPVSPGQHFCANCGATLDDLARTSSGAVPRDGSWDPVAEADARSIHLPRDVGRTSTGCLLMMVGFALLWIPYVSYVGGIIGFVGVIFFWIGRQGLGDSQRRNVFAGGACIVLGFLAEVVLGVWFADDIATAAGMPGETLAQLGGLFRADLGILLVGTLVVGAVISFGNVLLPYALADPTSRWLLWGAFVASTLIGAVTLAVLWPQITTAIAQATSGATFHVAPVQTLEARSALWGAAQILPDLLFLTAYYRVRSDLRAGRSGGTGKPPVPGKYGRLG